MSNIRLGVIGYGNIGTAHAACIGAGLIEGAALSAVCDLNPDRLRAAGEKHPGAALFSSHEELIVSGAADAVIIAVPHPFHSLIARAALRAGLPTLVEKPLDISVTQAQTALSAAKESGTIFAVMLNQRTNPLFRRAREIVGGGALGELKRTVWTITNWYRTQRYYDSGAWRATWAGEGGGVLLNQAPHNLDLWQWICGMPVSVRGFCDTARYHRIEVEDDATLLTRYDNGATGLFITSTGEYPGTNRLEISGTKGKLVLEEGKLRWWKLREDEAAFRFASDQGFARIPMDYAEESFDGDGPGHAGILQNFTNAILRGEALLSPAGDGLNELMLSNAAYLSQWQGNAEIPLPLSGGDFDRELQKRAQTSLYRDGARIELPTGSYSERWKTQW